MPLNIDFHQIFLHLFNFVILFAALYFILYKPVKDFMEKRTKYYEELDGKAENKLSEAESKRKEYEEKLSSAADDAGEIKKKILSEAENQSAKLIKDAEAKAEDIIADARRKTESEREAMLAKVKGEVSDIVADAAEKMILTATSESYDGFLDTAERGISDAQRK